MKSGRSISLIKVIGANAALAAMLTTTMVRADAVCVQGYRDTTAAEGGFDLVPRANVAARVAHGLSVRVRADENRLASMLDAIDWNGLAAALSE